MKYKLIIIIVLFGIVELSCQLKNGKPKGNGDDFFNTYDPSKNFEFGRINPDAPIETKQFEFLIGNFICKDSIVTNGKWKYSTATWNSEYILNGYGIKDTYRNDDYAATSIRFFNTKTNKWNVYFYGMPGEHTGLWEGEKIGNDLVMKQKRKGPNNENLESRLIFYEISNDSFKWKGVDWNLDNDTGIYDWKIIANKQ